MRYLCRVCNEPSIGPPSMEEMQRICAIDSRHHRQDLTPERYQSWNAHMVKTGYQSLWLVARERLDGLTPAPGPESASDPMAVAVEAKVQVVLSHRKLISRIRGIVQDLLTVTEYQVAEVRGRVEALPEDLRGIKALEQIGESRAVGENLRTLTTTANQLVEMEREAFGIQAAEGPREETYEERLKRLIAQSKETSK